MYTAAFLFKGPMILNVTRVHSHCKGSWGKKVPTISSKTAQKVEEWRAENGQGLQQVLLALAPLRCAPCSHTALALGYISLHCWLKCGYYSQNHFKQASIPDLAALATKWQASNATLTWCLAVSIPSRTVVLKSSCLPCGRKEDNSGTLLHKLR